MSIATAWAQSFVRTIRGMCAGSAVVALALLPPTQAAAQGSISIVRDAEIEALVRDYAKPILGAAGLSQSGIEIVLVNNPTFNAFVAGRRIFINTGTLLTAETPNEVIGVLAHEAGHIAGGHQQRLRNQLARAQTIAVVSTVLGIGAGIAGASAGNGGLGQAGMGMAMGGAELARRSLLGYQRTEEITADRSAITYLQRTGQSARGMLKTFERFASNMALAGTRIDPYQISHPMPRDRIANLRTLAEASPHFGRSDPPALQVRHDLARAKIAAYTQGQAATARLFRGDPNSLPARYADVIMTFLHGAPRTALSKVDALIRSQPNNAYFHEMRGEILMKANRPREAAEALATAMRLDPSRSGLLRVAYGRALFLTGNPEAVRKSVGELKAGLNQSPEYSAGYRYLAQAYGQLGQIGDAELASAEGHYYAGNYTQAKIFAARAQQKMPNGSPGWLRAQDIINYRATK